MLALSAATGAPGSWTGLKLVADAAVRPVVTPAMEAVIATSRTEVRVPLRTPRGRGCNRHGATPMVTSRLRGPLDFGSSNAP